MKLTEGERLLIALNVVSSLDTYRMTPAAQKAEFDRRVKEAESASS